VDEIETRAIGASGPYVRALNLVGTVTVQLDATDSIDEAVWFILESGFRQKKELSTSAQTQVIEEAPPVLEDTAIVGEDLLKVLIRSSRYSHLSKKEFLSAMMKKKIMGSKEEEE
jgi:hypothetical protein